MSIIVAIDAGTTGVRAVAVREDGRVGPYSYREFTQHFPRPGWVEHDPNEIWEATLVVLGELIELLDAPVAAIGITNQRETVVVWDSETGEPLHRAIVWQDRRTAERCKQLESNGHLELIRDRTGLVLDPYFSASKLQWIFENGVERNDRVRFGTIDSWLIHKLSGHRAHYTDVSNASRTMLFDIVNTQWSEELCALFDIPMTCLAEVRPSSGLMTTTAANLPIAEGTPISGVAGDQQASLFGQACFKKGKAKITYGTGSFLLVNAGATTPKPTEGLLNTIAWQIGSDDLVYAVEGSAFVTGAAIQWLRDGLGLIEEASEVGPLAQSVPDAGGVYFVPAFTGLGSPWWDPHARGTIVGLTRGTTKAHIARAVVEAIALSCADIGDALSAANQETISEFRVDGGASVMDLLCALQADLLGVPVLRSANVETTALGAAYLAGMAIDLWSSTDEIASITHHDATFEPGRSAPEMEGLRKGWLRAVERSRDWASPVTS
ncbi:MAG: glycerol kinase GlpK [Acidobacteria bacterium]|nr:glycerol kinase GlpK [Acidobacteriota bacterium]